MMSILLQHCRYPATLSKCDLYCIRRSHFTSKVLDSLKLAFSFYYFIITFFFWNTLFFFLSCQKKMDFDQNVVVGYNSSLAFSSPPDMFEYVTPHRPPLHLIFSAVVTGSPCSPQSSPSRTSSLLLWGDSASRTGVCSKTHSSPPRTVLSSPKATAWAKSLGRDLR